MTLMRPIKIIFVLGAVVSGWLISSVSAGSAISASIIEETYRELMQWRTVDGTVIAPGKEIIIESDCAKWTLKSGSVAYVNPLSDNQFTGFVFEGEGLFEMDIPDPLERDQLVRFSDAKLKDRIRLPFNRCIIRDSGNRLAELNMVNASEAPVPNKILRKRHETVLKSGFMDMDARVLMGALNDKDDFLFADIETKEFGWLTYLFDRDEQEEIQLLKFDEKKEMFDTWISLDCEADRLVSGRPSRSVREIIDIVHVDMDVNLMDVKWVSASAANRSKIVKSDSRMTMKVRFKPALEGIRCIEFELDSTAKVTGVKDSAGQDLTFVRDHIGDRSISLDDELWDDSLYVFFTEALTPCTEYEIEVSYDLEIMNFASGRAWYPAGPGGFNDQHTVSFKAILNDKFDIFAVGRKLQEQVEAGRKISSWQTTSPTAMYGFTYGKNFEQERIRIEGQPDVISFGTEDGFTTGNMVRNVGVDVANSLKFYEWFLDEKLQDEPIYVTSIDAWHGQAFEGLIHLARYTYLSEHPGETEVFRAHETAHQFWGHVVGWQTYRDQWISEGFAEYFAMLFLETTMDNPKFFKDSLESHAKMAMGAAGYKLTEWSRPWSQTVPGAKMKNIGPIDAGHRAATIDLPSGYYIQAYEKGAMVLHMIRVLLRNSTRSEDAFRDVIRTFLNTYRGKNPTTSDFQTVLESKTKSDWGWFFDQWIDHSYIPRYEWSWDLGTKNDDGTYPLTVKIRQSGVPDNFRMIVPLAIDYKNGKRTQMILPIDKSENTFTFDVGQKPEELVLNPDWSVLAEVKMK